MPNNAGATKKKRTFKVKKLEEVKPKEKLYKVTLTLGFKKHHDDPEDFEKGDEGAYGRNETNEEFCERFQGFKMTEKEYGTDEKIQEYVKEVDAMEFVEFLPPGKVLSAKWLDGFRITFVFRLDSPQYKSIEEIKDYLKYFSLEDGEYGSSGDNGWTIKTVNGKYEYGLTDYRRKPILVEEVSSNVLSGGKRKKSQTRTRR